jgi:hypothetical protein
MCILDRYSLFWVTQYSFGIQFTYISEKIIDTLDFADITKLFRPNSSVCHVHVPVTNQAN